MKRIAIILLFTSVIIFGQDYSNNYYPLAIGNKWVYESNGHWMEIVDSSIKVYHWTSPLSVEVVDTVQSNVRVFELLITMENIFNNTIETMTWYETYYEECEVYSSYSLINLFNDYEKRIELCSTVGDSAQFKFFDYRFNNQPVTLYHIADSTYNLFGDNTTAQFFEKATEDEFYNMKITQGFGLTEQHGGTADDSWESHLTLKGAVIDGVVYGDTSLILSAVKNENNVQNKFSLSQNYPNPFNPTTTIKFTIPSVETTRRVVSTKLVVYDILGREVKTLLNKPMQPGQYEVQFDGSDLPSGVYFYRLTSGEFTQARKMLLLK